MPFRSAADPEQIALISAVLDAYCEENGIATGTTEQDAIAHRILFLFGTGVTDKEQLSAMLKSSMQKSPS